MADLCHAHGLSATRVGSEDEERELELIEVYVADISPEQAQALSRVLARHIRQPELAHLKRIRSDRRTVHAHNAASDDICSGKRAPASAKSEGAATQNTAHVQAAEPASSSAPPRLVALLCTATTPPEALGEEVVRALLPFALRPRLACVPRHPPAARWQYDAWQPIWPLNCPAHISTAVQRALAEPELSSLAGHMRTAMTAANAAALREGADSVGVVIVAPDGVTQLAVGAHSIWPSGGHRTNHPLQHAVMRAISAVAAQNVRAREARAAANKAASKADVTVAGDKAVQAAQATDGAHPAGNYLCAGCTAVLTVEPCAMCAMALLHSRIGRVVYAVADPVAGALGSQYRLHTHRQLNHRFDVHRGLCAHEMKTGIAASCCGNSAWVDASDLPS